MIFMEYMRAGGAIMWILRGLSGAAATFVIERIMFFAASSADGEKLGKFFDSGILDDDIARAKHSIAGRGSLRRLFIAACDAWDTGGDGLRSAMEGCIREELFKWERNLPFLEITAKVAPLLGLLGTVLGMVDMFRTLNLGGSVSSSAVTGGIWKALLTTVAGLTVAIPAVMAHGIMCGRVAREEEKMNNSADFIMKRYFERKRV